MTHLVARLTLHLRRHISLIDDPPQLSIDDWAECSHFHLLRWHTLGALLPCLMGIPEDLPCNFLLLESWVKVARYHTQRVCTVVLEIEQQRPELGGVDDRVRFVCPLTLGEGLRKFVRDDAMEHEVVQAVGQLLTHDGMEI